MHLGHSRALLTRNRIPRLGTSYNELCEIAYVKLKRPPTPAELLDILATYLANTTDENDSI